MDQELPPYQPAMTRDEESAVKARIPLCEPCQRFFRSEGGDEQTPHHLSAESFQQALQQSCLLCSFVWAKFVAKDPREAIPNTTSLCLIADSEVLGLGAIELQYYIEGESDRINGLEFIIAPWNDMLSHESPAILSRTTGSTSAVQFIFDKYRDCKTDHHLCNALKPKQLFHPSRLIDVGQLGDERIRLHVDSAIDIEEPYFCLSHCWGKVQPYILTKSTSQALKSGIATALLPKTFQDAIWVTRTARVRYLWIDSLCIFQDDNDDWEFEASRMQDVYSQAACVIAATAAKTSSKGLFYDRKPETIRPLRMEPQWTPRVERLNKSGNRPEAYWVDQIHLWKYEIEEAPLNARAWVAQERHLARCTMHFGKRLLVWECYESKASENYPKGMPEWALPYWSSRTHELKDSLCRWKLQKESVQGKEKSQSIQDPMLMRSIYFDWLKFRIGYSRCNMSKEDDILVAIAGVAQDFGTTFGDELVAGLWKSRLLEELCWLKHMSVEPYGKPTIWLAPTWSWASKIGTIWMSNITKYHDSCVGKEIWPTLLSIDVESKPSGALVQASIRVKCQLMQCRLVSVVQPSYFGFEHKIVLLVLTEVGLRWVRSIATIDNGIIVNLDDDDWNRTGLVSMFVIQRCAHDRASIDDDIKGDCIEGLVIERDVKRQETYRRLGTFTVLGNEAVKAAIKEHEASETKIIELI